MSFCRCGDVLPDPPFIIEGATVCKQCARAQMLGFLGSIEDDMKAGLQSGKYILGPEEQGARPILSNPQWPGWKDEQDD